MIDGGTVLRIGIRAKGLRDKAADKPVSGLPATAEAYALISLVVYKGVENARFCVFQAFDAPARADKIVGVAFYRAPLFAW